MAAPYSTTSELNSLFSNIFEGAFFVQRQMEMIPRLVSNASARTMAPRIFPKYTQNTAGTVAEGGTPTPGTLAKTSAGTVTPVIYHHQFQLTDERIMTDPDDARRDAARESGMAISTKIDADGVALFASYTAVKGTGGSVLTLANIAAAMAVLQHNSVPAPYYGVLHPFQWNDILNQFTSVNVNPINVTPGELANQALRDYFVSRYLAVNWFMNANIGTTGTAGTTFGAVFNPNAQVYDERTPMTMEIARDDSARAFRINTVIRAGQAIRRNEYAVKLRSRAFEPS